METPTIGLLIVEKRTPNSIALEGEKPQEWIYAGNAWEWGAWWNERTTNVKAESDTSVEERAGAGKLRRGADLVSGCFQSL
jgi:hypothetical protein